MRRPNLTLCMIAHDESETLTRALMSAQGGYDDLVVAVGSLASPVTVALARQWGARLTLHQAACDREGRLSDFAAARNTAIRSVQTEYWWWMDADEIALSGTASFLRNAIKGRPRWGIAGLTCQGVRKWFRPRLVPRDSLHVWQRAVHEILLTPNGCLPVPGVVFHHS